ncbi:type II 3-dehydroquinate dehydratase [Natronoglycomyces albus]|uniref:3-dehydroquinate dehydratase n=1 Tax=Natronoglycomyces albus TaxID=2811108 RepID=A0A895XYB3_9ACTN|nr:type II 3-dehydroquinate dehydratase [Natronoglycomyces albus]QSB06608.1 type II 3-dehydroquinate dehydratase [Natronoglycomyces albus]
MKVLVLGGPNLNRLGTRQPAVYGSQTHSDLEKLCVETGKRLDLEVDVRQTNHEGELLEWLHEAADEHTPVVLNAAAWTHTSVAVGDACAQLRAPLIEVHISNVYQRESFRHHSYVSAHAVGVIAGLGFAGYTAALEFLGAQLATGDAS